MSNWEGDKKPVYRLEYTRSSRSRCTGPRPWKGTNIEKGGLRFGSFAGNMAFPWEWRHWGCVTPHILNNLKKSFSQAEELDGFDELSEEDQERVKKAWEEGHVAPEDIPESAKKGVFKLGYALSRRSKCQVCNEYISKGLFRLGIEVDFRGDISLYWQHWGCAEDRVVEALKASYDEPAKIDDFDNLKEGEKEKVQRAWEEGKIPDDDKGPGEVAETGKEAAGDSGSFGGMGVTQPVPPTGLFTTNSSMSALSAPETNN
ncbi:zf-PARP-domain-containing protein [Lentinus tigrinus ALCF2SS1-7]|uniref:Zf-PARP-domain-containing protein n=1 Tax=Lentinus tigrinus ALCF2SS1-6 TaxID=1328759 RepID=A0A5C2S0K6_9APHY|nr:zf-PARP-domain-containing protein [Lentinus tigrinus ALCF2SS1-6]RPD71763.1 zf-PARP-domain-containing protein [Lentinus tigrinus ALCF2SS1-7]